MEQLRVAAGIGFIFDMDGVLIESMGMHLEAWRRYLEERGVSSEETLKQMLGKRNDELVVAFFGEHLKEEEIFGHGAAKERLYRQMMAPVFEQNVVDGVVEFVRAAHEAGIGCALATNAEPLNAEFVLTKLGLKECFRAVVDGHQVLKAKPDPEVILKAAAELGISPRNCVMFEDSPGGMQAARSAGTWLVALLTTLDDAPLADLAVADFRDPRLNQWLSTLSPRSV
jgi:HAD superfamily hydrolase (TIGR01509 family)